MCSPTKIVLIGTASNRWDCTWGWWLCYMCTNRSPIAQIEKTFPNLTNQKLIQSKNIIPNKSLVNSPVRMKFCSSSVHHIGCLTIYSIQIYNISACVVLVCTQNEWMNQQHGGFHITLVYTVFAYVYEWDWAYNFCNFRRFIYISNTHFQVAPSVSLNNEWKI